MRYLDLGKKITQKELIKIFDKTDNYYVRVRKKTNHGHGNIYYNGIKIYEVLQTQLNINDKLLQFNSTNINKIKKPDELLAELKSFRDFFYNKYELKSIVLERGKAVEDDTEISDKDEYFKKILMDIEHDITNKYKTKIEKKQRKENKQLINYTEYTITFDNPLSINDEYKLFYHIYVNKKYKVKNFNVFKSVKPKYLKNRNILKLEEYIKEADHIITSYYDYTEPEIEKMYQHQFLLNEYKKNKGPFASTIPFEEEYNIGSDSKNGRVDCIFYKINDINEISDIFFIEIKVNDSVLGGSNGITKHLDDIKKLKKDEFTIVRDLINYRESFLNEDEINHELSKNFNVYFDIIIAWENKDKLKIVEDKLKELKSEIMIAYEQIKKNTNIKVSMYIDKNPWDDKNNYKSYFDEDRFEDWLKSE